MKYYALNPEVAGDLGRNTKMDSSVHPPIVLRLHFELDAWLGDGLIQTFPCYLATTELCAQIEAAGCTGVRFEKAEVSASEEFYELQPDTLMPDLTWLQISGKPREADFGLTADARLVVSEHALHAIKRARLNHCDIAPFKDR